MWNYLKDVQSKPLHTRKLILYVTTAVLFVVIVFIWILLLNIQKAHEFTATSNEGALSPFQDIKEIFNNMFEAVKKENPMPFSGLEQGVVSTSTDTLSTTTDATNSTEEMTGATTTAATGTPLQM